MYPLPENRGPKQTGTYSIGSLNVSIDTVIGGTTPISLRHLILALRSLGCSSEIDTIKKLLKIPVRTSSSPSAPEMLSSIIPETVPFAKEIQIIADSFSLTTIFHANFTPPTTESSAKKVDQATVSVMKEMEKLPECALCMDKERNIAYDPCGHIVSCMKCFEGMKKQECSVCSALITRTLKVFLS
jgi:hypothetical protein